MTWLVKMVTKFYWSIYSHCVYKLAVCPSWGGCPINLTIFWTEKAKLEADMHTKLHHWNTRTKAVKIFFQYAMEGSTIPKANTQTSSAIMLYMCPNLITRFGSIKCAKLSINLKLNIFKTSHKAITFKGLTCSYSTNQ